MNTLFSESNQETQLRGEGMPVGGAGDGPSAGSPVRAEPPQGVADGAEPEPPDIHRYEEYRAFLRDRFAWLQSRDASFSQRGMARKAGIANPGFFNEVIKGRRRLSQAAAAKMAHGLDLAEADSEYFSALVAYAEARDARARLEAGRRLLELRSLALTRTPEDLPAVSESLRGIVRELDREWVLQGAGLDVRPERKEEPEPVTAEPLIEMSEGAFQRILDKLVDIREKAEADGPVVRKSGPVVRVNLQVQPRGAAAGRAG